jgi:hypothetical protein
MQKKVLRPAVEELPEAAPREVGELYETISIDVTLSGRDLVNVRRIVGSEFEPDSNARLVVRVRKK